MYFLYSIALSVAAFVGLPYWLFIAVRERKYLQNFRQRLSWELPEIASPDRPLWVHAVSVGEVLAAKPLIHALKLAMPKLPIIVSTITITGQTLARKELSNGCLVFYFPFDWDFCVTRFLELLQPRAVVLMETELWPNFLKGCFNRKIPIFLANGRISDRSFNRYHRIWRIMRHILREVQVIGAQTHQDKRRFLELGAAEDQVRVTGNLKFDFLVPAMEAQGDLIPLIQRWLALDGDSPVIVVGSSMRGEEPLFLEVFRKVAETIPDVRMILAPRHPERFDEVAELLAKSGLPFRRRSQIDDGSVRPEAKVLLLDSIGELSSVYSLATVSVIGGSFLPFGGHNLLEPAGLGKAIVFGPEMSNFKEMAQVFLREQAARQASPQSLAQALTELLQNARARNLLGHRALSTYRQNQGATQNTVDFLVPHLQ